MKEIIVNIVTNAIFITIATLVLKHLFNKNLINKEGQIERELERNKSDLQFKLSTEQDLVNKKRQVYIELVDSMSIFIGNRVPSTQQYEYKAKFLKAYDTAWLWASDSVLKELSIYMQLKIDNSPENQEKEAFARCVLAMRKDIGFNETEITLQDYKFILI